MSSVAGFATAIPFGAGCTLGHLASARPVLGTNISLDTTNVPAAALVGATLLGLTELNPPLDLSVLGMPGCYQHISIDASTMWVVASGVGSTVFTIPNVSAFAGLVISTQGAALVPGANAMGALTSSALRLTLDIN